jgi:hypothetical protein
MKARYLSLIEINFVCFDIKSFEEKYLFLKENFCSWVLFLERKGTKMDFFFLLGKILFSPPNYPFSPDGPQTIKACTLAPTNYQILVF